MNSMKSLPKKKILFEFYTEETTQNLSLVNRKIKQHKENQVKSVFLVTSERVDSVNYTALVDKYKTHRFSVTSFHVPSLKNEQLPEIKYAVETIIATGHHENCLIVSYGKGYAGVFIACYLIARGRKPEDAIGRVMKFQKGFLEREEEKTFVYNFEKYLNEPSSFRNGEHVSASSFNSSSVEIKDARPVARREQVEAVGQAGPSTVNEQETVIFDDRSDETVIPLSENLIHSEKQPDEREQPAPVQTEVEAVSTEPEKKEKKHKKQKKKQKKGKAEINREHADDAVEISRRDLKPRKFYNTIQFKLVSIISVIIIISLGVMIFLATYFFRNDNQIRVEENTLLVSRVTGLKVETDFLTIIEKSRFIPNVIDKSTAAEANQFWSNEKDILFVGVAQKQGDNVRIRRAFYNPVVLSEMQLSENDIDAVTAAYGNNFARSFKGETVVQNISEGLKVPTVGLSFPPTENIQGAVNKVFICYVRLQTILQAFESKGGITKLFMVNENGDIIAHPDGSYVISGGNYSKLPIVKMMITSKTDNGYTRYIDENGVSNLGSFQKIGFGGCGVVATVNEKKAFREVYNIQRRNLIITGIVLVTAILIIFYFGRSLTVPITRLVGATQKIKEGHYNVNIAATTNDEIGELTDSFVEMGIGLEEREKMKDAFGKFVNKEIAEQVLKGDVRLGGERKDVVVFFSDIRSFTAISERMEPEQVVEFLNEYMTRMVDCINDTNGVVDKFIGDAIMAIWGAPVSTGNDIENAVNAALAMRNELILFNEGRGQENNPVIKIGCGINTGPVLAGQIGSSERMEYTVIGDTVNLASRIEALNKPFGTDILITEDTYNYVNEIYRVEPMQKIRVKGKEEPQQIYAVLGRVDDETAPRTVEELRNILGTELKADLSKTTDATEEVKYEIIQ